jgi:hypothetical protein
MNLILSRKGLDSSFGNLPSPILPDGRLCWLPIFEDSAHKPDLPTYNDVTFDEFNMGDIVTMLSRDKVCGTQTIHLDPDLKRSYFERKNGWKPMFGQTGAAERHLRNNGVDIGDIFLYFGWFRQTEAVQGQLRFKSGAPDLHVIFGWMQIAKRMELNLFSEIEDWMHQHPHIQGSTYSTLDSVYFPVQSLAGFSLDYEIPGAGLF